uniref:39S ribosomal protein L48 n=1 Tax=Schistocephalus solidus TaxID=70667 RepID=A0A0V0J5W2_SCHSO
MLVRLPALFTTSLWFPSLSSHFRTVKTFSYDPFYISLKPSIPVCPTVQLCLNGYDFPVLERYERYARVALGRWAETVSSFPLPPRKTMYKTYHPNSTKVKAEFELSKYCRVFTIDGIKSVDLPIIVDLLQQNLPEGVEMTLQEYDPQLEESRYVANLEMETLQSELEKLSK